jgi:uncharacterized iron-regulated protein
LTRATRLRLPRAIIGPAVLGAVLALAGCAGWPADEGRIFEVASGRTLDRAELLAALRQADAVMLGEVHDNPSHHALRGQVVAELGAQASVVAEQMPRGRRVGPGNDVRSRLEAAGFDSRAWGWPMYEPLFGPILEAGLPLHGASAPNDLVRQVARGGADAAPVDLKVLIDRSALDGASLAQLDRDLEDGHCGRLPAARLPAMRSAQRLRDASMWLALRESAGKPAVLLAGNGHVRRDYGVPRLAAVDRSNWRSVSVGFVETGAEVLGAPFDYVWITRPADREDPCANISIRP